MKPKFPNYLHIRGLIKQFNFIKKSSYQGVNGVWKIQSGKPGPVLGITLHTHGNEPSGLAVLSHFREKFPLERHLKNGAVVFALNNILAPFTGHSIFAPPGITVKDPREEVMFYLRPPRVITIE